MYKILGSDGKEYGPVTLGNVIEWIRDGRANLQTKARKAGETEWKTLGDFPEFVPTASGPAFPPPVIEAEPIAQPVFVPVSPATAVDLPQAGLLRRLAAATVDGSLQWLCWMPAGIAASNFVSSRLADHEALSLDLMRQAITESIGKSIPFILLLAVIQSVLLCRRSQSVGKILLGLQIVTVREGVPAGPLRAYLLRGLLTSAIEWITGLGFLYVMFDSFFIFREDQRCLHDLIAGTKVVKLDQRSGP